MHQTAAVFPEVARDFLISGVPEILKSSLSLWMKRDRQDECNRREFLELKKASLDYLKFLKRSACISKRSGCTKSLARLIKELEKEKPDYELVYQDLAALEDALKRVARTRKRRVERWPTLAEKRQEWEDYRVTKQKEAEGF
ncbi:MAG: hypothetical protein ACOCVY_01490 [Patescibacteria group bacterium]